MDTSNATGPSALPWSARQAKERRVAGVTAVYDRHSYDAEKRAALDFWGRHVEAIVRIFFKNLEPAVGLEPTTC